MSKGHVEINFENLFKAKKGHAFYFLSTFSDGQHTDAIYRGHQLFKNFGKEDLLEASVQGAKYLTRSVKSNGSFVYNYDPVFDLEGRDYNILRHAGTTYSMVQVYRVNKDPELLSAIQRAFKYLIEQIEDCEYKGKRSRCLVEHDNVKVGGHGLAILAMSEYQSVTGDDSYLNVAKELADWLKITQAADGRFEAHKVNVRTGQVSDFRSGYYPGEAIFALTQLYKHDKNQLWIDIAEKNAEYLVTVRDKGVPITKLAHDHWLLYGLNYVYRERPKAIYLEHVRKLVNAIRASQNFKPSVPDFLGSFENIPRSTPTATRSEGLTAAYMLERDHGSNENAAEILKSILAAVRFQLQTVLRPERVMYFKNPQRALGGVTHSLSDYTVRIDYVQHNISSMLATAEILDGVNK